MWGKFIVMLKREWRTVFVFGVVGGSSFLVKASGYALLSRVLWTGGSRSLQNVIALAVAMVYNYTLHRVWTFNHQKPATGSGPRYVAVVFVASVMDAALFYVGHEILGVYDFLVLFLNACIGATFTFTAHRFFTFHSNPYKRRSDVIQSS